MDRREAFRTLGLPSTATPLEIKQAHRDLAKMWHPDRFGTDPRLRHKAEETLKGINEAYQLLQSGATGRSRGSTAPRSKPPAPAPPRRTSPTNQPPPPRQAPPRKTQRVTFSRPFLLSVVLSVVLVLIWIASSLSNPRVTAPPERALTIPARNIPVESTAASVPTPEALTELKPLPYIAIQTPTVQSTP